MYTTYIYIYIFIYIYIYTLFGLETKHFRFLKIRQGYWENMCKRPVSLNIIKRNSQVLM